jgi:adenylate kinase
VRIVLLGAPGSGKGTQGDRVAAELGLPHLSSGAILRAEAGSGSELGRRLAPLLEGGDLVPDELTDSVVGPVIAAAEADGGYVLDGYPRTVTQARQLDGVDLVIHLALPDDVAGARLAARDEGRADDADPDVIARRLEVYHDETAPLLDLYEQQGCLVTVDADQPPDRVTAAVEAAVTRSSRRA